MCRVPTAETEDGEDVGVEKVVAGPKRFGVDQEVGLWSTSTFRSRVGGRVIGEK